MHPVINGIAIQGYGSITLSAGSIVFVVGPNNGGKSTFLEEILAKTQRATDTKWISSLSWQLGTKEEFDAYVDEHFIPDPESTLVLDRRTGAKVMTAQSYGFFKSYTTNHPSFLIRYLNASTRIELANATDGPDVISKRELHPYHSFFFNVGLEVKFSEKIKEAFGYDFRINRTGTKVAGLLGRSPSGDRLSEQYEAEILNTMAPIYSLGDGIRSYTGILLNAIADSRPITIIDEPEAFLHPPQARKLGFEIASEAERSSRQVFVATHSTDFIQGALASGNKNLQFLYLDHSNTERPVYNVARDTVDEFSSTPFLENTNALDSLFYPQVIICEGEADIMFFKWALADTELGRFAQDSFWISSYGKSAIPQMFANMAKLGVRVQCVFDLDVLLSREILVRICELVQVDFSQHEATLRRLEHEIRVPPAAEALTKIEQIVSGLDPADEEDSRGEAIRAIKKQANSLGRSWSLKTAGLSLIPKGDLYGRVKSFIEILRSKGIVILEEGEIENYVPNVGGHGQSWVRAAIELGPLAVDRRATLERQFASLFQ